MRKILSYDFQELIGQSLEDKPELWKFLDQSRNTRKSTIHPRIKRLNEDAARESILSVL